MITEATPAHASALAAIHAAAFPPREAWGEDAISLQLALPGGFGLIDERGGMLLGRIAADEAEVLTLAVAPSVRRQGIATALLRATTERVRAHGGTAIFLEVATGNAAALALYRREGFIEVGRRRRYYADSSDALVLRMNLLRDHPPRRSSSVATPSASVSSDSTSCPCSRAVRGTLRSGSSPRSRTSRVWPGRHAIQRQPRAHECHRADLCRDVQFPVGSRRVCHVTVWPLRVIRMATTYMATTFRVERAPGDARPRGVAVGLDRPDPDRLRRCRPAPTLPVSGGWPRMTGPG